jgi:hypothetical protein
MERKIGQFARTKNGYIGRIIDEHLSLDAKHMMYKIEINNESFIEPFEDNVLISSYDLFDVIFAGDYINGKNGGKIKAKVTDKFGRYFLVGHTGVFTTSEIKSIMTQEKYLEIKQMKQELKESEKNSEFII